MPVLRAKKQEKKKKAEEGWHRWSRAELRVIRKMEQEQEAKEARSRAQNVWAHDVRLRAKVKEETEDSSEDAEIEAKKHAAGREVDGQGEGRDGRRRDGSQDKNT